MVMQLASNIIHFFFLVSVSFTLRIVSFWIVFGFVRFLFSSHFLVFLECARDCGISLLMMQHGHHKTLCGVLVDAVQNVFENERKTFFGRIFLPCHCRDWVLLVWLSAVHRIHSVSSSPVLYVQHPIEFNNHHPIVVIYWYRWLIGASSISRSRHQIGADKHVKTTENTTVFCFCFFSCRRSQSRRLICFPLRATFSSSSSSSLSYLDIVRCLNRVLICKLFTWHGLSMHASHSTAADEDRSNNKFVGWFRLGAPSVRCLCLFID